MIVSYHPCFVADENRICAGRLPDETDRKAISQASAVILPQGCYRLLYEMARKHCPNRFPDYAARFRYPGKTGQARLFQKIGVAHPETLVFGSLAAFPSAGCDFVPPMDFPFVLKFDWGGEGEGVFLIQTMRQLRSVLEKLQPGPLGQTDGFVVQKVVAAGGRSLRVVVIGQTVLSYWRVGKTPDAFATGISSGAAIDPEADPDRQAAGRNAVKAFCSRTGINLAGFDLLFSTEKDPVRPLFLEINYFFGRRGLGGSKAYYRLLVAEIQRWLEDLGLGSHRWPEGDRGLDA